MGRKTIVKMTVRNGVKEYKVIGHEDGGGCNNMPDERILDMLSKQDVKGYGTGGTIIEAGQTSECCDRPILPELEETHADNIERFDEDDDTIKQINKNRDMTQNYGT